MKKIALSALVIAASGAYVWSQAGSASDPLLAGASLQTGSIQGQTLASTGGSVAPREVPFVTGGTAPAADPAPAAPAPAPDTSSALPPLPDPGNSFAPSAPQSSADATPTAPASTPTVVAEAQSPASAPSPTQDTASNVPLPRLRPPYHQVAAAAPTQAPASAPSSQPEAPAPVPVMARINAATTGLNDGTYRGPVVNAYYGLMQIEAVIRNGRLATVRVLQYPNTHGTSIYINRRALPQLRDEVITAQSARVDIVSGATLSSHAFIQSLGGALRKARA